MTKLVVTLVAALCLLALMPYDAHADSKGKGSQKSGSKATTSALAPARPAATPSRVAPTAVPSTASSARSAGAAGSPNSGTITTEEARAVVEADAAAQAASAASEVSPEPAPRVDPLSLIQPARPAQVFRTGAPSRGAADVSTETHQQAVSLFPISAGPLTALLLASQVCLALTILGLRYAGRLARFLNGAPLNGRSLSQKPAARH